MSSTDPPILTPDSQPSLCSVWSCSCDGPVEDIQVSAHGVVAVSTEKSVHLYTGAPHFGTSQEIYVAPAKLKSYKFSASGSELITGGSDGSIKWWEVHSGEESSCSQFPCLKGEQNIGEDSLAVNCIVCAKEEDGFVAAAAGRTICIFTAMGEHLHTIGPLAGTVLGLEWRKSGELAANIGIAICIFCVEDKAFRPGQQYSADSGALTVLASSPVGEMLAAGCTNGSVRIWDLSSEAGGQISVHIKVFLRAPDATEHVKCLAWDESGHFLATAGGSDVVVWDMEESSPEEGKDNSIVCYGHAQNAKITALQFQNNGNLLATGGDDCQVEVFDSSNFNSNEMVSGLIGSILSVRVGDETEGASITALAWHPSGLILAGTNLGKVDAFEVGPSEPENMMPNFFPGDSEQPFLVRPNIPPERAQFGTILPIMPQRTSNGRQPAPVWEGGAMASHPKDESPEKLVPPTVRRISNHTRPANDAGSRRPSRPTVSKDPRPKAMFHDINPIKTTKQPSRYSYPEQPQQQPTHQATPSQQPSPHQQQGAWHMVPPMMPWVSPYPPQMQYTQVQYPMAQNVPSSPSPYTSLPASQPSDSHRENVQQGGNPSSVRVPAPNPQQPSTGQYPMASYVHYPYRMPYPGPYSYYSMAQPPPVQEENAVLPQPPPAYQAPHNAPSPHMNTSRPSTRDFPRPMSSSDINDDAASKSSEITSNGVGGMAPVAPSDSSVSVYDHDGSRALQTLYIGNLASAVDEHLLMQYFSSFGPVTNIQVIRDRDTRLSRGFAFVTYSYPMCAQMAMQHMDTMQLFGPFEGRRLKVSFSNRR